MSNAASARAIASSAPLALPQQFADFTDDVARQQPDADHARRNIYSLAVERRHRELARRLHQRHQTRDAAEPQGILFARARYAWRPSPAASSAGPKHSPFRRCPRHRETARPWPDRRQAFRRFAPTPEPRQPSSSSSQCVAGASVSSAFIGFVTRPAVPFGTRNKPYRLRPSSTAITASTRNRSATGPLVTQALRPRMTNPVPSGSAVVCRCLGWAPAPGSEIEIAVQTSPAAMRGSHVARWS